MTRILWVVGLVGAPLILGLVLARYPSAPAEMPTHYNLAGEADGWGPKWVLVIILAVLVVLVEGLGWLARRPQWFNYPFEITPVNAQAVYRAGERMMVWLNLALLAVLAGVAMTYFDLANVGTGVAVSAGLTAGIVLPPVGIGLMVRAANRAKATYNLSGP
ncbi:MAG: DUF1648 domain-containing protein [Bifidobacteriaceae bacterium]|nr:DUF1648 domain-containing protein [Bifidobacteriaceae bacterium]